MKTHNVILAALSFTAAGFVLGAVIGLMLTAAAIAIPSNPEPARAPRIIQPIVKSKAKR